MRLLCLPLRSPSVLACTQTLSYFSFRSFRKHRRAKRACENKQGAREGKIKKGFFSSSPTPTPLRWRSINPLRLVFYNARSTDFEKKLEGLWTGYLRVSIRSSLHCLAFIVFSYRRILSFAIQNVLSEPEFTYRNLLYPKAYYCINLNACQTS